MHSIITCGCGFVLALVAGSMMLSFASAQTCKVGNQNVQVGYMQKNLDDGCKVDVCRCSSEDQCEMNTELRMVLIKVNETKQTGADTQTMQCSCVEYVEDSNEMEFVCKSVSQPGRDIGAKMKGCLDFRNGFFLPNENVTIINSRNEKMQCICNSNGHYENCQPEDDPGDSCLDAETGRRVPLRGTYYRLERNSQNRTLRLRCTCVRSDQETVCTVV